MCVQLSLRSACAYAQSDQSLCLSLEYSVIVKLLTEHHLEFLTLKGGCRGLSESTLVKIPHCWKSHVAAQFFLLLFQVLVSASITVGNQLSRDENGNGTEYILNPRDTLTFNYKEGHSSCRSDIIHNPYNSNCRDLPPLCQVSVGK